MKYFEPENLLPIEEIKRQRSDVEILIFDLLEDRIVGYSARKEEARADGNKQKFRDNAVAVVVLGVILRSMELIERADIVANADIELAHIFTIARAYPTMQSYIDSCTYSEDEDLKGDDNSGYVAE
jgi:hypothetical protein